MDRPGDFALFFLGNAVGVVDQTRAANERAAHGAPAALVPTLISAGRALQLVLRGQLADFLKDVAMYDGPIVLRPRPAASTPDGLKRARGSR